MRKLLSIALAVAVLSSCQKDSKKETKYQVNETVSKAKWKGSAPDHFHTGHFTVKGNLETGSDGVIKSGEFLIPVLSIENYDLPEEVKPQLLDHLKSPDFFNMALHPNAEFRIISVTPYSGADAEAIAGANYKITGNFSMVGQTHAISFPAKITTTSDSIKTEAKLVLDRTKWGMTSYSDPSQEMYILPGVQMDLDIRSAKIKD